MNLEMQPSEKLIDTWTVIFLPNNSTKINGKLSVTNQRLIYEMQYNISTIQEVYESSYTSQSDENSILEIPKEDITKVEVEKSVFQKKVIVTVRNGAQFIFSYGIMNIDHKNPIAKYSEEI